MYQRTLAGHLERLTKNFSAILITGPRQVGKSTLLETFVANKPQYHKVTLDNLEERAKAINDPAWFLQEHRPPVLIDEVQYAPNLFSYIKMYIDQHRDQKGLFLLTGSQKFHLMKNLQETLAGRVAILNMLGLSRREITGRYLEPPFLPTDEYIANIKQRPASSASILDIYAEIFNGSFPALINQNGEDRDIYFSSYIATYIDRDVSSHYKIRDAITFNNFVKAAAARTGQLLNLADIARDVAIDAKTAKLWLSVLEASGLVYLLHPYFNNITSRVIKTPKLYFLDTGLCAYLTGWDSPKSLMSGALSGAILETYVVTEILKSYWHNAREPGLYFYRDKDAREVDLVLEANNTIYPVEIKKTLSPSPHLTRNLKVLHNLNKPMAKGVVLCLKPEVSLIDRENVALPIASL